MALKRCNDVRQADWIVNALRNDYTVGMLVPPVFEAYARILHTIGTNTERMSRWREIAAKRSRRIHARVQFSKIASEIDLAPRVGSMPVEDSRALVDSLRPYALEPCWFCFWHGYAFLEAEARRSDSLLVEGVLDRVYLLYSGKIEDVLELNRWPFFQTPNIWWSSNRLWCVATEVDLDSTYVGGSAALVNSLLGNPSLETLSASVNDSITISSDDINA